ncbi:arsenite efflux transporter metallochaperone ArsD [Halapricum desulfuricans]|uniref:Arsenical resistance operon trans-acting repressor ArsD n=1 Tax=Halapricum desulfuricans TaxID=2841257 RepID=A0A897MWS3_9EURY|nr:arsenite efflux transporter metallochaperone ArsD [Halapricum desulfuricans]QSG04917.1 Arsenical resistance operon trans-acting repressor ArsD [Halapricum desulfuricans]
MIEVTVFEEAMCCTTGVCGPDPDEELVRFTRTVDRLEEEYEAVEVRRASLAHDTDAFLNHQAIYDTVQENGPEVLPITTVDDEVIAEGEYLDYDRIESAVSQRVAQEA